MNKRIKKLLVPILFLTITLPFLYFYHFSKGKNTPPTPPQDNTTTAMTSPQNYTPPPVPKVSKPLSKKKKKVIARSKKNPHTKKRPLKGKKAVIFYLSNPKQRIRIQKIKDSLQPDEIIIIEAGHHIDLSRLHGSYRYILFTGDHGDIHGPGHPHHGEPSTINGMGVNTFIVALQQINIQTHLLILDTCFSASALPLFIQENIFHPGAIAIVSIGVCQGWTTTLIEAGKNAPLGPIFAQIRGAIQKKFGHAYHSIAIYKHGKNRAGTLYKQRYTNLYKELNKVDYLGINETVEDLQRIQAFLIREGITVQEKKKKDFDKIFDALLKNKRL